MEQKQKKKQKKIYVILAILLVLAVALIGLAASGTITNWVAKYQSQKNYEALIASKDNVTDEMTLRQLLLLDEELEITVTEDIVVKVGFTVNGTKTLRGDATIASNLGIFQPISILEVSNDASLTMDGLVVDGNANAIGIKVNEKGELTYLSGEIIYAGTYGILSNGVTTIEDVSISNCITAAIDAGFKGKVYFNGGELVNNRHIGVYVEAQGYMEINEGAVIDGTSGQGIRNRGELVINGGKFNDIGRFVVTNHGMLTIDYDGSDDGYIEMTNIGSGVVYNNNTGTSVVKDVHATNLGTDAMKCVGGTMTVENCIFENSGAHGFYISYGEVTIKDVKATNLGACGIYTISKANITLDNVELENIKTRGIMSKGSTITGNNVTIKNAGTYAISNERSSDGTPAKAEYTNLTVSESGSNNVFNGGEGTTVTIKDSVLNETPATNVYVGNGELTLDNVEILGTSVDDKAAISIASKGTCNLSGNSKIHGNGIRGVNISGVFNMKGGEIYGFYPKKQSGGAVRLYKGGVFNMSGGSIYNNQTQYAAGAVFLNTDTTFNMTGGKIYGNTAGQTSGAVQISINSTFNMKGGEIYNNKSLENSGGAIMVQGVMNMSGGEIYKNTSASVGGAINLNSRTDSKTGKKVYGEFNLTGGKLYENVATANGGALHVSSGTTANLSGGKMYDNVARKGTGVNDNGNATVSGTFDLGNDTFTLGGTKIVVRIKGNTIGSHSASNPFRLEPGNYSDIGVIAAECDSVAAATAIHKIIAAQTGSYKLGQSENNIVVGGYTVADMSMEGADTVYVSNFQELKAAVEGTTSSRNVVICADIVMEGLVTVPDGTTVKLRDDGNKRTLSRKDNVVSAFFTASFGTGLIVDVTKEGNLVFNGDGTNDAGKEFVQLMVVRGTTVVDGVVFKENGAEGQTRDGAFILQKYGDITITNSSFTGAHGLTGGAVTVTVGTATIKNSTFEDNTAKYNAGALRVSKEAHVTVTDCTFKNNSAKTVGGAINCDGGKLTVEGSTFENNTSVGTSGAINLTNGAVATVDGTTFNGNASTNDDAGAIKVNKSSLALTDSIFKDNTTVGSGGAVFVVGKINADTYANITATGCTFENNSANKTGGAIKGETGVGITLEDTKFIQNVIIGEGTTGGAIDVYKATIDATGVSFEKNAANTYGGAIYLNTGSVANLTDCQFNENVGKTLGGAIYVFENGTAIADSCTFTGNKSETYEGGAIANKGNLTVSNSTFTANESKTHGGAIYAADESTLNTITDCTFDGNISGKNGAAVIIESEAVVTISGSEFKNNNAGNEGGAIYTSGTLESVSNCTFTKNISKGSGGAVYVNTGATATFEDSSFAENATNEQAGGAIYTKGSIVTDACTFTSNGAKTRGGAIWINGDAASATVSNSTFTTNTSGNTGAGLEVNGGTAENVIVSNCTFDSNDATNNGDAIYVRTGKTITISGGTFINDGNEVAFESSSNMGQAIISGTITGVTFKYSQANKAGLVIAEAGIAGSDITILPKAYIKGHVLVEKSDATSDAILKAAIKLIKIADNGDDLEWVVESDGTIKPLGTLQVNIAQNATTGVKYTSIQAAVNEAQNGEIIYILYDMEVEDATTISGGKNVIITNAPGKNVILIRAFAGSLFTVEDGSTLTLGSADATYEFTIDGGYSAEANDSIIAPALVNNAGTFELKENATLQNAYTKASSNNANYNGGALYNTGIANLSGNFIGNKGYNGGAVYNADGTLNIMGGIYSDNIGAGQGGAIYVASGTDSATIANAEITRNDVSQAHSRGVAIYLQGGASALTLENCNIHDNMVEYLNDTDIGSDVMIADNTTLNLKNNINVGVVHQRYGGTKPYGVINLVENYTGKVVIVPNNNNFTVGVTQLVNYVSEMTVDEKVETASQIVVRKVTNGVADDTTYYIDEAGYLRQHVAKIGENYYKTLSEAVENVSTASEEATVIEVLVNETLSEAITLLEGQIVVLRNSTDTEVKLTRDAASVDSMFVVVANSSLTVDGTSAIVLDGGYVTTDTSTTTVKSLIQNAGTLTLGANVTVQSANSKATSSSASNEYKGGALYNTGSANLNANFTGNTGFNGGAIYGSGGTITITGGTYSYNTANNNGGVIAGSSVVTIETGTFQYNTAVAGGGVLYLGADSEIKGGVFSDNEAQGATGGVIYSNKKITITGGTYENNKAATGGGVINVAGTSNISGVTMTGNTLTTTRGKTFYGGAAIYVGNGKTLTLSNCKIYGNTSSYDSKVPSCDVRFNNTTTYNKAAISGITVADNEKCYVCVGTTKYYVNADGSTLTEVE